MNLGRVKHPREGSLKKSRDFRANRPPFDFGLLARPRSLAKRPCAASGPLRQLAESSCYEMCKSKSLGPRTTYAESLRGTRWRPGSPFALEIFGCVMVKCRHVHAASRGGNLHGKIFRPISFGLRLMRPGSRNEWNDGPTHGLRGQSPCKVCLNRIGVTAPGSSRSPADEAVAKGGTYRGIWDVARARARRWGAMNASEPPSSRGGGRP